MAVPGRPPSLGASSLSLFYYSGCSRLRCARGGSEREKKRRAVDHAPSAQPNCSEIACQLLAGSYRIAWHRISLAVQAVGDGVHGAKSGRGERFTPFLPHRPCCTSCLSTHHPRLRRPLALAADLSPSLSPNNPTDISRLSSIDPLSSACFRGCFRPRPFHTSAPAPSPTVQTPSHPRSLPFAYPTARGAEHACLLGIGNRTRYEPLNAGERLLCCPCCPGASQSSDMLSSASSPLPDAHTDNRVAFSCGVVTRGRLLEDRELVSSRPLSSRL